MMLVEALSQSITMYHKKVPGYEHPYWNDNIDFCGTMLFEFFHFHLFLCRKVYKRTDQLKMNE